MLIRLKESHLLKPTSHNEDPKYEGSKKQGDMREVGGNSECKIIYDSGINSRNESIEDIEEELQVIYDSYRDTLKDIYEKKIEAAASKIYEA